MSFNNSDAVVGVIDTPAVFTGGDLSADALFDGLVAGTTTLDIIQPVGHTTPSNGYTTRTINVTAPDVYLREDYGTSDPYRDPFVVGLDLQIDTYVQFEVALPGAVDVVASVPSGSGVLLSASPTEAGSESLVVVSGYTSGSAAPRITGSPIYVQGTVQGDDLDDDVPVTIDVFDAGTTDPVGFEQADMPSVIDVGPSGFSFTTSNDLLTTTFSPLEEVRVNPIRVVRQRVRHAAQAPAALSSYGAAIALR